MNAFWNWSKHAINFLRYFLNEFVVYDIRHTTSACTKSLKLTIFSPNKVVNVVISRITELVLGLIVLIWKHFSCWNQIWQWNFEFRGGKNIIKFLLSRLYLTSTFEGLRTCHLTTTWSAIAVRVGVGYSHTISKDRMMQVEEFEKYVLKQNVYMLSQ